MKLVSQCICNSTSSSRCFVTDACGRNEVTTSISDVMEECCAFLRTSLTPQAAVAFRQELLVKVQEHGPSADTNSNSR
mgnify:CR=1 FL=1